MPVSSRAEHSGDADASDQVGVVAADGLDTFKRLAELLGGDLFSVALLD